MSQAQGQRVQTLENAQPLPQTPRQMESPARKSSQPQQQRTNGPPPGGGMLQELQKGFFEEGLEEVAAGFGLIKPDLGSSRKSEAAVRWFQSLLSRQGRMKSIITCWHQLCRQRKSSALVRGDNLAVC